MKMRETSRGRDKELYGNNNLFLNPERISWPDIDVDIQYSRRSEVIDYVKNKYGDECVSRIITFGTLAARAVLRDVGKVLGISPQMILTITNYIPKKPKMTIAKALDENPEFRNLYEVDASIKYWVDCSKVIEGLPRHKSQHACGVVISAIPISDTVPEALLKDSKGNVARTAIYTMTELEELGLLKMDFLGLRNLGVISDSCHAIGISENAIPLDDPYVYELLATGDTNGVFQLESGGMKGLMKDMFWDVSARIKKIKNNKEEMSTLGQECFERLIAAISLYRPGPMDYIPDYVRGMRNPATIHYDTPLLEQILKKTYGVIVYQEQVQQIVRDLAGYSLGRGDLIRRVMSKKKTEAMDKEKEIFLYGNEKAFKAGKDDKLVAGCVANGIAIESAKIIWDKMSLFSLYAFNKSHAAGYAVISVQTAWLKLYHKNIFWCSILNSVIDKADSIKKYIASAKVNGVKLINPDINNSLEKFSLDGKNIRMGLQSLRNLGKTAIPLIEERNNGGRFADFSDFVHRVLPEKKLLESLVFSGALDCFEGTRRGKNMTGEAILAYRTKKRNKATTFVMPEVDKWFDSLYPIEIPCVEEIPEADKLDCEYIYAGMYITKHPLESYMNSLLFKFRPISELAVDTDDDFDIEMAEEISEKVIVIGIVKELESKVTRTGKSMKIFVLEDTTGSIRTTVFSDKLEQIEDILMNNATVKIDGLWKVDGFGSQIIVNSMVTLDSVKVDKTTYYQIRMQDDNIQKILDVVDSNDVRSDENDAMNIVLITTTGERLFIRKTANEQGNRIMTVADVKSEPKPHNLLRISSSIEAKAILTNEFQVKVIAKIVEK